MHGSNPNNASDAPRAASLEVYEDVKQHSAKPRLNSELVILDSIRAAHPQDHVVQTNKDWCDLLGFAESGAAKAELRTEHRDFEATRKYWTSGKRIDNTAKLEDKVKWGCFDYTWEGNEYTVYKHEYYDRYRGSVTNFFVCYHWAVDEVETGKCQAIDNLLWACGKWSKLLHDEIWVFDGGYWDKSSTLWNSVRDASWDDVILDPQMKSNIKEDVDGFFASRELYKDLAVPWKRGIILHGHPGNGKTITIKSLIKSLHASEDQIPSLYVKSIKSCNGKEYCIRNIFAVARNMAPCLLIFEDLDSLVTNDVRSYFLNEVDGLESNDGILMIGSTNHLDRLDPAIAKRPSRFDRKYHFKLPAEAERLLYCDFWKGKVSRSKTVTWPEGASEFITTLTEGFSFAYMKELFVMTLLSVARGSELPQLQKSSTDPKQDENASQPGASQEVKDLIQEVKDLIAEVKKSSKGTAGATASETDEAKKNKAASKPKRSIADVEVPEGLQQDAMIQHVRHHVQLLLDDMDNTDEESAKPGDKEKSEDEHGDCGCDT